MKDEDRHRFFGNENDEALHVDGINPVFMTMMMLARGIEYKITYIQRDRCHFKFLHSQNYCEPVMTIGWLSVLRKY